MQKIIRTVLLASCAPLLPLSPAMAQSTAPQASEDNGGTEIVVTANKREESLNKVGLSVQAISGDVLAERKLSSLEDVVSVVPGLSFTPSASNTPILTLRGVGFNETSLGVYPAVTVYIDQAPILFPTMALHSAYDLERVEVLKGPQGTLFGQNSTGGAINYIAAKPTREFTAGADISYGRFNSIEANGFVSGPLSDNVRVRLALSGKHQDGWQKSYTHDNDTNAKQDYIAGRFLIDFDAGEKAKFSVNFNAWHDTSEPQVGQLFATHEGETDDNPNRPASAPVSDVLRNIYSPLFTPGFANAELSYPFAPFNARFADWSNSALDPKTATTQFGFPGDPTVSAAFGPGASDIATAKQTQFKPFGDRKFWQGSLRGDIEVADGLTLTSLTSYTHFKQNQSLDADGMTVVAYNSEYDKGLIKSFNQELRIANDGAGGFRFLLGGNYEHTTTLEDQDIRYFGNGNYKSSTFHINSTRIRLDQKINNYAFFGNVEYKLTDQLTLKASGRYTHSRILADNRNLSDPGGNVNAFFDFLSKVAFGNTFTPTVPGVDPYAFNTQPINDPHNGVDVLAKTKILSKAGTFPNIVPGIPFVAELTEHNVSWRVGLDYQASDDILAYANVSRGFKGGNFPVIAAANWQALLPVLQERVTAYEVGLKTSFLDKKVSLNLAAFYYDYVNKQVRGKFADPVFGLLDVLVNVPKSTIKGIEAELNLRPAPGLTIGAAATYLDAKIKRYVGFDVFGGLDHPNFDPAKDNTQDMSGQRLPYTPKFAVVVNLDYKHKLANGGAPFFGLTLKAQSEQDSAIGASVTTFPVGPRYRIAPGLSTTPYVVPGYATLDARVGYEGNDGAWRIFAWAKNLTNKYYITAISSTGDQSTRYTGMPATYGVTVGVKIR